MTQQKRPNSTTVFTTVFTTERGLLLKQHSKRGPMTQQKRPTIKAKEA